MRKRVAIALAAAAALALAGCSGTGATEKNGSGLTTITVGVIPIVSTAPIFLGKEQGFFKDEGLDVKIQTGGGGAALVPGVVSGAYDFGYSNVMSIMVARDKGLDLKYVINGASTSGTPDSQAVIVRKDSPIKEAADLAGKRVGVNNLSNVNDTTIRTVVAEDGGDESTIKFVEVAFPDAEAAVTNKQVDASIVNPFLGEADADAKGFRVLMYNFSAFDPALDISGYFTTGDTIKNKADEVKKFTAAMAKSLKYAQDHPDEVRRIVPTYTKISTEQLKAMVFPTYRADFNRAAAEKLGAAALKYGTVKSKPKLDDLLP